MNDQENFRDYMWNKDSNGPSRSECTKRGCRKLETRCLECGRAVNKITIPVIEREWIKVADRSPDAEEMEQYGGWFLVKFAYAKKPELLKFGTKYWCYHNYSELTHWMPLPGPPKD